ncbi:unnamed protein product, partial [Mesorhabditis belari]|uniref:Uncharacterized protein n=1 Tax=Mesorhabditis belari TaxID=2138241 RepID=A0AAF3FFH7_9BILA
MDPYRLALLMIDPPLVAFQIHLLRIVFTSKKKELNGPYYAFYKSTAISAIIHRIAEYYSAVATALKIIHNYPLMAKLSLYLQFGGFVSIALGTCLISLNRLTACFLAVRSGVADWLRFYVIVQNLVAYSHCIPVLFTEITFMQTGEYKFIAIPETMALAMKLCAVISGVLVILICCPASAASAILIAKRRTYQRVRLKDDRRLQMN